MPRLLRGLLVLVLTACGAGTPDAAPPLVTAVPSESSPSSGATSSGPGTAAPTPTPDDPPAPSAPATPQDTGNDTPADGAPLTEVDDDGPVGANGRAYLRGDRGRVVVEVDVQDGASLPSGALDHLRATLAGLTASEVVLDVDGVFASERTDWSTADLRATSDATRDVRSDATTATLHLLVVRGGHVRDGETTSAIGLAYSASQIAVFPDRWSDLGGSLLGTSEQVARSVLVHELGHLLGLVNLTYTSAIDHEDPDHPGHSSNRGSVMYWAIESTAIGQVFSGPPPDTFDDADLADLDALRSGEAG